MPLRTVLLLTPFSAEIGLLRLLELTRETAVFLLELIELIEYRGETRRARDST